MLILVLFLVATAPPSENSELELEPVLTSSVVVLHGFAAKGCGDCHDASGWRPARFEHERRAGYRLDGAHVSLACGRCHVEDLRAAVPRSCDGCHRDPHRGDLGIRCSGCHDSNRWESRFRSDAHARTAFPLSGAHAVIPCEACHEDRFARGFVGAAARCADCHQDAVASAALTSIDHIQAGFGDDCERCHTPWRFSTATFPEHESCFQIIGGEHAGIPCLGCHSSLDGLQIDGRCETRNASCTSCHEHDRANTDDEHGDVPGYQYEDRKCYECHRFAAD